MNPEFIQWLADAGPSVLFALAIWMLIRGRHVVLRRELDRCEERLKELAREKEEYRHMAYKAVGLGEKLVDVAKDKG